MGLPSQSAMTGRSRSNRGLWSGLVTVEFTNRDLRGVRLSLSGRDSRSAVLELEEDGVWLLVVATVVVVVVVVLVFVGVFVVVVVVALLVVVVVVVVLFFLLW